MKLLAAAIAVLMLAGCGEAKPKKIKFQDIDFSEMPDLNQRMQSKMDQVQKAIEAQEAAERAAKRKN